MRFQVQNILLVCSPYDFFMLEEDGRVTERMVGTYLDLNLRQTPLLTHVTTGEEAVARVARDSRVQLVISSMHVGQMPFAEMARRLRSLRPKLPIVLLAYDEIELETFFRRNAASIDGAFVWQGDFRILLGVVKIVEDQVNAPYDCAVRGVPLVLLVEDSVRYMSSFLPVIYAELMEHSQRLLWEEVNRSAKILRMRARPKLLLARTYEQAWEVCTAYHDVMLGVLSDFEFPHAGALDPRAGIELVRAVRTLSPDLPIVLQSSRERNRAVAQAEGAPFVLKGSDTLLHDLRRLMLEFFGFGDFVFRVPDGREVGRASDMQSLEATLRKVPAESIAYHAERNHFSKWLKARAEFALAHELRPRQISDYPNIEALRHDLIGSIARQREERKAGVVVDFDRARFDGSPGFYRLGGGSLGGKARGLAFAGRLFAEHALEDAFDGVRVTVPSALVIGTDVFDQFLDDNGLRELALGETDFATIQRRFAQAKFPEEARRDLEAFVKQVRCPLAARSSSLLEDAQNQPFSGVYETFMLANHHPDPAVRLAQLLTAVKAVYASTFSEQAKGYIRGTRYRLEEEKMAVVIQHIVGTAHGHRFYPDFSGVARTWNYYPTPPAQSEDGIVAVALGLGRMVVEGGRCVRFCPKYPQHPVQFSTVAEKLDHSQNAFWALDLEAAAQADLAASAMRESEYDLADAAADGTLAQLGSTYVAENDAVYDGLSRPGVRLVSFASVLKYGTFPLTQILERLMIIGREGMGGPVEI